MPDPLPLAPSSASPPPASFVGDTGERAALLPQARASISGRRLVEALGAPCLAGLSWPALAALARGEPVDPNRPSSWAHPDAHARAVLARHRVTDVRAEQLTMAAIRTLIDGQARADAEAGVDWSAPGGPDPATLTRAHARLPLDLADPAVYAHGADRRRALAARLGVAPADARDLSGWALTQPGGLEPGLLRAWRIASPRWLALADEQLGPVGRVERPVGLLLRAAVGEPGWQLIPALSADAIRSLAALGAAIAEDLRAATLPAQAAERLLERLDAHALHAGGRDALDAPARLAKALTAVLGVEITGAGPRDPRERWGRLLVTRRAHKTGDGRGRAEIGLRVVTFGSRRYPRRRLGAAPLDPTLAAASAVMELGEAVDAAVQRELPLLLSPEAAGALGHRVRVARMTGRPGRLTVTTLDGASASTRRVTAEQAPAALRALRDGGRPVTLDAGARELVAMTLARPLADDPILLGRQREVAALKVLGSGVDASQVGTGKTITSARALAQRAATTPRLRALVIAEGRLLAQWQRELTAGDPARGLPPLAPNVTVTTLDERRPVAAQVRAFDRSLGQRPGVLLAANGVLDRFADALGAIAWHLLIADEALRYANPATDAHRALAALRMSRVADCWLLTATPRGKSTEHLDVLVGLALGERAMIRERLGTREAGDLLDELNAHRLRAGYGPHLVRVTRSDLAAHLPTLAPAVALALEPDPALETLLEAVRRGGRDAYRRLLALLKQLRAHEPGSPLARAALAELARVQGAVLSNVGVYLDASVDPETLRHSKAALAQALDRQGLVEPAMRGGGDGLPLLRGVTAQTIARAAGEQQVLVFAERVRCLSQLAACLRERHGLAAAVGDGATGPARFEQLKHAFAAGELRVLCLSRIGHEGHNLQSASTLVHLDLPWLPGGLEQRVGRAARPGAASGEIATYIPYVKGAGLEHVVSVLSPRAGEHHQLLDAFDGVPASQSSVAAQLADITDQVAASKRASGYAGTAARLRVAAAVFGG